MLAGELAVITKEEGAQTTTYIHRVGEEQPLFFKMTDCDGISLAFNISRRRNYWFADFLTSKRILKGSQINIVLKDAQPIQLTVHTGALKVDKYWHTITVIDQAKFMLIDNHELLSVSVTLPKQLSTLSFPVCENSEVEFKEAYRLLLSSQPQTAVIDALPKTNQYNQNTQVYSGYVDNNGPILTRQYNLNTKYGRRMARQQAAYNYQHGSDQYRADIDSIGTTVWTIIIVFCAIVFIIVCATSGPEAALKMLK